MGKFHFCGLVGGNRRLLKMQVAFFFLLASLLLLSSSVSGHQNNKKIFQNFKDIKEKLNELNMVKETTVQDNDDNDWWNCTIYENKRICVELPWCSFNNMCSYKRVDEISDVGHVAANAPWWDC